MSLGKDWQTFSIKRQKVNILGFAGCHKINDVI
jgi:hypothetical protein